MAASGMGHLGEQSKGTFLQPDFRRPEAVKKGVRDVHSSHAIDSACDAKRLGRVVLREAPWGSGKSSADARHISHDANNSTAISRKRSAFISTLESTNSRMQVC